MPHTATFGSGYQTPSGEIIETDTTAAHLYCDRVCMSRHVRACGFICEAPAGVEIDTTAPVRVGHPVTGETTDDCATVSYGDSPATHFPCHEYCPACGTLVDHGDGDDADRWTCNGDHDCEAPDAVDIPEGAEIIAVMDARNAGEIAAKNAASWVLDGNTPTETYREILRAMSEGDPRADDALPACPSLSGEWADSATPASLVTEHYPYEHDGTVPDRIVEAIVTAWEEGVSETFTSECERLLRAAIDDDLDRIQRPGQHEGRTR